MMMTSSSSKNEPCCSKDCKKNTKTLNSKITEISDELADKVNLIYHYKLALAQVESRLVEYKERDVKYIEKSEPLSFMIRAYLQPQRILKISLKVKECADDTVTDYSRPSPTVESTSEDGQNRNSFASKNREPTNSILSKPMVKFVKAVDRPAERPTTNKAETVKKPTVKYAEMDRIICDLNKTPDLFQEPPQNCPKCGNPVDGQYCQGCALLPKKFMEDLFTYCIENGIFQYSQDTSKPSNDNTNVVNALQEPFVVKQDPGESSSQSPPHINHHCCYGCGDSLEDIFCHQCTCEFCGKGAHYGYNCSPKVSVFSNREPCHNPNVDELPQTLTSFHPTCYSGDEDSFVLDLTSNIVHDAPNDRPTICYNDDDDEDYTIAITPILSTNKPNNSLSMGDEHLDTISEMESDELIKFSVEDLIPILSESEGISDNICDVPFHDNSLPFDISKDQFEDFSDSNVNSTSIDDDSFSTNDIEYVEASPPYSELVSLEVMEILILEEGGIDAYILLTIKDDILHEKLLNINLLIVNIVALKDNPNPYSDFMTKSSSTSLNFPLEETNTFDNSLPESKTFCFDLKEISSVTIFLLLFTLSMLPKCLSKL
nr:hypothetical protein [Tanacetum cinerariifolium]